MLVRAWRRGRRLEQPRNFVSEVEERSAFIHREIFQLAGLVAIAVAAFLVTRAVAASNRDMSLRDAAEWFRRGQEAMRRPSRRRDRSLRRATVRDRDDKRYVLALAQALALKHDTRSRAQRPDDAAGIRPEDREINLQLARLAATRQDVTEALRFYHNALYAPWPIEQADARRAVRLELIRFLSPTIKPAGRSPNCSR